MQRINWKDVCDKGSIWNPSNCECECDKSCDCMFLSCHVCVSEWIHNLQLPECQGTPCLKQARNLKVKWLQLDSNPEPLSS